MVFKRIKNYLKKFKNSTMRKGIDRNVRHVNKNEIIKGYNSLGIGVGDSVLVHSSLKSLGYVEGGPETVIQALIEVVSPSGTIVIPTYSMKGSMYKTCLAEDYLFDVRLAGTELGKIPETFLKFPNVQRSIHPTHAVSAIGKFAQFLTESHHLAGSTFGPDSPWDRLLKIDGKIMGLGVSLSPIGFYHTLEDMTSSRFPLPVRMNKTYYLKCMDWNGEIIQVPVTPLDPEYAKNRIDKKIRDDLRVYFWQDFYLSGILTVGKVGEATAWVASAKKFYDHLEYLMTEGITIYSTPEQLKKRPPKGRVQH